jgi:type II secretory pathway pseudopilin PulG
MRRRRTPLASTNAGFGLVDICVALVVLSGALGILVVAVFSGIRMARADEETAIANQALRSAIARLQALPARDAFAILNDDSADDIDGETSAEYLDLSEHLLSDREGEALTISVLLPVDEAAPGALREDLDLPELGLPRDLDGDGTIDSADHADDLVLLPVLLRLEWQGASGAHTLQMATILSD